ncbi:hypothetical protein [Bacillus sp. EAC]|uniref:hypothetical protein n=1 Tax=Bacillus sp. EAC TaxID=1978338 RepID=UPI000B43AD74|nr:hypothetical protein [Bacillus sp. EAC]
MLKQLHFFLSTSSFATQMPGFRTRTTWKQFAAMIGYPILMVLIYVYMRYQMDLTSTAKDVIFLGLNNFVVVLCMIILPFILITNVRDIRKKLPLFNSGRQILGIILTVFLLFSIMGIGTTSISKLYSDAFSEKLK